MRFMHLSGLWLLAGIVPVVLLYMLKARRRRVKVPSSWLWQASQRDLQARSPFKKLKNELSLILELLALTVLALALAAPACRGRALTGEHVAIIIDVSASMAARDGSTRRTAIEDARAAARRVADGLAFGSDAMVLTSGRDARVLFPLGRDRDALRSAIDRATALDVEGDIPAAVALAVDRLRSLAGTRRVVVVTDGLTARAPSLAQPSVPVQVVHVGRARDNAAIVRMDVRAARQGTEGDVVQAFALVANFGTRPRDVFVTARRDGETAVVASRRVRLEPDRREAITLTFPLRAEDIGRGMLVEIEPRDDLATDDVAYARIPSGSILPVVLVSSTESPWIRRALQADPSVTLTTRTPTEPLRPPEHALVVFDGTCPASIPEGHDALIFGPPEGRCLDVTARGAVDAPEITSYVNTDARFRFLTMDGVHVASARPLALGPAANELLRAGEHTLIADVSTPERAVTVVGFDPGDSDWPLRASFVLFVRNIEELARAHRARVALGGGRTGEPLRVAVPRGVRDAEVRGPQGSRRVPVASGSVVIGETSRAGFYRIRWNGGETLAPINLVSDAESNLRVARLTVAGGAPPTDARSLVRPHEELAPWLAIAAMALLLANLAWVTRRERRPARRVSPKGAQA